VSETAAAKTEQQHRKLPALGTKVSEAPKHSHLTSVYQLGASGGHSDVPDHPGDGCASLDDSQNFSVKPVYFQTQRRDIWRCASDNRSTARVSHVVLLKLWCAQTGWEYDFVDKAWHFRLWRLASGLLRALFDNLEVSPHDIQ